MDFGPCDYLSVFDDGIDIPASGHRSSIFC